MMPGDAATGHPFIAAMVISKLRGGLLAPRFFDCAARLGRFIGDAMGSETWMFHTVDINAALAFWAPLNKFCESE